MPCDKNINSILDIDFSAVSDEFNWLTNGTIPIETIDGQLRLIPEAATSQFVRGLGNLDPTNNRIRLRCDMEVLRPQVSLDETFCATFGVYLGSALIDEFTVYMDELVTGDRTQFNLDRLYYYEGAGGALSLRITTPEGFGNELYLNYLKCEDFNYCDDDVRTYFLIDNFLEDALASVSSAVQLLEWKVDDVETLTAAFFSENNAPGGDPSTDWKFALANIDGSDRNADVTDPNTFNPFVTEWGLDFEDVVDNHFGGKPTGVTSASDYGPGILQIGFEKPEILNGLLAQKNGAFFVDIDFTKNLKIVFNVLVNNTNADVFDSPDIYRKYTILWDATEKCAKQFYYNDVLNNNEFKDEINNGFLSGITGTETTTVQVGCDEAFAYNGQNGEFSFVINFGTDIGQAGIDYNAFSVPDKFEIDWNGNTYSSGYVGSNSRDQDLLNLGISPTEINTGNPSTGIGSLLFTKDSAEPQTAVVRVTAPFSGTAWNITGRCPDVPTMIPPTVTIDTPILNVTAGDSIQFNTTFGDVDGNVVAWNIDWGGEGSINGSPTPPPTINKTFTTFGTKEITISVTDNDGLVATDTVIIQVFGAQQYQVNGNTFQGCGNLPINGTIEVLSGSITILWEFFDVQGTPVSGDLTIDGVTLNAYEFRVLGVGSYPYSATSVNCSNGSGHNELLIF